MNIRNTGQAYGSVARILHWLVAALILILLPMGVFMHELPQGTDVEVAFKVWLFSVHKTLGIIAFVLAVIRLFWAMTNPKPHPLAATPPLQHFAAEVVHWMLYAGILITPLAGYLHHLSIAGSAPIYLPVPASLPFVPQTTSMADLSGMLHFLSAAMMGISLMAHIGGALFHAVLLKDDTLARMLPLLRLRGDATKAPSGEQLPMLLAGAIFATVLIFGGFYTGADAGGEGKPLSLSSEGQWDVDHEDSKLEIQILQMGEVVLGEFTNWQATINLDPAALEQASITAVIELNSIAIGMATEQALGAEFLNTEAEGLATWQSSEVTEISPGQYRAEGALALRGVEVPVPLEFSLSIDGDNAVAEAIADINRLDFGIGSIGYTTEESLGFTVRIRAVIVAERDE